MRTTGSTILALHLDRSVRLDDLVAMKEKTAFEVHYPQRINLKGKPMGQRTRTTGVAVIGVIAATMLAAIAASYQQVVRKPGYCVPTGEAQPAPPPCELECYLWCSDPEVEIIYNGGFCLGVFPPFGCSETTINGPTTSVRKCSCDHFAFDCIDDGLSYSGSAPHQVCSWG